MENTAVEKTAEVVERKVQDGNVTMHLSSIGTKIFYKVFVTEEQTADGLSYSNRHESVYDFLDKVSGLNVHFSQAVSADIAKLDESEQSDLIVTLWQDYETWRTNPVNTDGIYVGGFTGLPKNIQIGEFYGDLDVCYEFRYEIELQTKDADGDYNPEEWILGDFSKQNAVEYADRLNALFAHFKNGEGEQLYAMVYTMYDTGEFENDMEYTNRLAGKFDTELGKFVHPVKGAQTAG